MGDNFKIKKKAIPGLQASSVDTKELVIAQGLNYDAPVNYQDRRYSDGGNSNYQASNSSNQFEKSFHDKFSNNNNNNNYNNNRNYQRHSFGSAGRNSGGRWGGGRNNSGRGRGYAPNKPRSMPANMLER